MKRKASTSASSKMSKKPRISRQDSTVTAVVRKELRKKTDWKYADLGIINSPVYYNGQPTSLLGNLIRGNLGLNNFQGNIIKPQAITLKYFCESSQETYEGIRIILFQWFDSATPQTGGILQDSNQTVALVSPTLVTNKGYIKILYDQLHMLSITANPAGNGITQGVTVYIPGKRLRPIRYNSSSNVVQDGNIYILAVSNDTALGTVNLTAYSRITFSDE